MRFRSLAVAAVAAVAIAGCGGDDGDSGGAESDSDSNQALSYDAFGTALDAVCTKFNAAADPSSLTGDPKQDLDAITALADAAEERLAETEALDPPEELQADYDTYLEVTRTVAGGIVDAKEAAEDGDAAEYTRVLEDTNAAVGEEGPLAASKLGAAECISN